MDDSELSSMLQSQLLAGQAAAAPPKKKKRRGGLAGIWDRNKKVIAPLVNIAAGAVGGPMLSSLTGGLMQGLDKKSLKAGLLGAATGAATGATAGKIARSGFNAAKAAGGLRNIGGAARNAATAMRGETGRMLGIGRGAGNAAAGGGATVGAGTGAGAGATAGSEFGGVAAGIGGGGSPVGGLLTGQATGTGIVGRPLAFFRNNPLIASQLISGATTAYSGARQEQMYREERQRQLQENQMRAQLLMPLFRQYLTGGQG